MSTRYLNPRPRYYYFRLLKTNAAILKFYPVSILTFLPSSACDSAPAYQILYELDDQRQSYDVRSIIQDGDHTVANLFPFSGMVRSHVSEGTELFAHQISTSYLNPRLRYYYFRS